MWREAKKRGRIQLDSIMCPPRPLFVEAQRHSIENLHDANWDRCSKKVSRKQENDFNLRARHSQSYNRVMSSDG